MNIKPGLIVNPSWRGQSHNNKYYLQPCTGEYKIVITCYAIYGWCYFIAWPSHFASTVEPYTNHCTGSRLDFASYGRSRLSSSLEMIYDTQILLPQYSPLRKKPPFERGFMTKWSHIILVYDIWHVVINFILKMYVLSQEYNQPPTPPILWQS